VYVTSPWNSHKRTLTETSVLQQRWLRLVLGFGFAVLGWMKIYNHDLTAGVADNYPGIMNDPMISLFSMGTDHVLLKRENWIVAFGLAEVLSGFMLMMGVFTRFWAVMMTIVFTKLMLVDFGWEEIPHIYPIAALMVIVFSSNLTTEFAFVERFERQAWRRGSTVRRFAVLAGAAVAISALAIYPMLYFLTYTTRAGM
jgi:uncharacterized membrane protein YphA (DoxX/SURF4 family)